MGKDRMRLAVEMVRKGATMLAEPCPQCGGIQVRYRGKVYCTNHEDLSDVLRVETISFDTVMAEMREVLIAKLNQAASRLETERDAAEQERLVSLMTSLFDLLQKLPRK